MQRLVAIVLDSSYIYYGLSDTHRLKTSHDLGSICTRVREALGRCGDGGGEVGERWDEARAMWRAQMGSLASKSEGVLYELDELVLVSVKTGGRAEGRRGELDALKTAQAREKHGNFDTRSSEAVKRRKL